MSDTYFPSSQCTDGRFTGKGVVAFSLRSYQNSPTASFWKITLKPKQTEKATSVSSRGITLPVEESFLHIVLKVYSSFHDFTTPGAI